MTITRSDRSATTPMSWVMSRIPASMRSRRSRISLRISACTVTSSAVVGSSAISSFGSRASAWAIIARCRWPPDSSCGYASTRRSGSGISTSLSSSIARCPGRLRRHRPVAAQHLGDLEADRVDWVERRHRLLEDHRDLRAADLPQRTLVDADQLAILELDRAADVVFLGSNPINDMAVVDLPEPDSPTIASTSPGREVERLASMTAGYHAPSTQKSIPRSRDLQDGCRAGPIGGVVTGRRFLPARRLPR